MSFSILVVHAVALDVDVGFHIAEIGFRAIDGDHAARLDSPDLTAASVSRALALLPRATDM